MFRICCIVPQGPDPLNCGPNLLFEACLGCDTYPFTLASPSFLVRCRPLHWGLPCCAERSFLNLIAFKSSFFFSQLVAANAIVALSPPLPPRFITPPFSQRFRQVFFLSHPNHVHLLVSTTFLSRLIFSTPFFFFLAPRSWAHHPYPGIFFLGFPWALVD